MLVTSRTLSFESTAFPVAENEDAQTNPGIYGKALAQWLSTRLNARGVATNPPFAEDWGWCVELANQMHRTGLACASEAGEKAAWRVYAFSDPGFFGRLRGKRAFVTAVDVLFDDVRDILSKELSVTNLRADEPGDR